PALAVFQPLDASPKAASSPGHQPKATDGKGRAADDFGDRLEQREISSLGFGVRSAGLGGRPRSVFRARMAIGGAAHRCCSAYHRKYRQAVILAWVSRADKRRTRPMDA